MHFLAEIVVIISPKSLKSVLKYLGTFLFLNFE